MVDLGMLDFSDRMRTGIYTLTSAPYQSVRYIYPNLLISRYSTVSLLFHLLAIVQSQYFLTVPEYIYKQVMEQNLELYLNGSFLLFQPQAVNHVVHGR